MKKIYKLSPIDFTTQKFNTVIKLDEMMAIPFSKDNFKYLDFKKEINEDKAELQDADGNVMSAEEAKTFIATLP